MAEAFVLDNSVSMAWCFTDEDDDYPVSVLRSLADAEAVTPAVWPLEVGNVLARSERLGRIDHSGSTRFIEMLLELPIRVEQETPARMLSDIISLAREHSLSTYDASYLDLALRLGVPLATRDESLKQAALNCGVPFFEPKD